MANTRSKNRVALRWRILGLASGQFPANVENGHDVLEWPQGERQALLWDRSRREVTHFVLIGVGVELREGPHLATMARWHIPNQSEVEAKAETKSGGLQSIVEFVCVLNEHEAIVVELRNLRIGGDFPEHSIVRLSVFLFGRDPIHCVDAMRPGLAVNPHRRNGKRQVDAAREGGEVAIEVPRDRNSTFEPQLVKKHQTHFDGFDDKIISMYARGMTVREIQGHLKELYGTEVSPDLISRVTDAVLDEVKGWQNRPLDAVWPIVYLDALVVKIRDQG